MNELMMGGMFQGDVPDQYVMQQYGVGTPADMGGYIPDIQNPAMQSLSSEMGQPMYPDMTGVVTPEDMLGRPAPQMSESDYLMLARQLGLVADDEQSVTLGADPMADPSYSSQYDIMSLLGGSY